MGDPTFSIDYFAQETSNLRDIWSNKAAWENFGEGRSTVERAFHGWFHLYTSCLPSEKQVLVEQIREATVREYTLRAMAVMDIQTLDAYCAGRWEGLLPNDKAFNLGYVEAGMGLTPSQVPARFADAYRRGREDWQNSF